jgi:SAM-dependent methyltransferase
MTFLTENYMRTGFPNNSFDNAFAIESVFYAVNKKETVGEISRILKPGGKFVIIDGFFTQDVQLNPFLQNLYEYDLQKRSAPGFISLQEMQQHLESAGFSDIILYNLSKNILGNYIFGGFFTSFRGIVSSEIKRLLKGWKAKSDEDTHEIMAGADFIEMLLGATKKIGYYAITATKK